MHFTIALILLVYVSHATVESRSFYPSFNDYAALKYNDLGEGDFDEVHEVHDDHDTAAVTQQHETFSPTVISPTAIDEDDAAAAAAATYGKHYHTEPGVRSTSGYKYEYHINSPYTGDYKTQQEERVGDVVRGSYSFIEPDGRKRIVEYTADPIHGFNAVVKHEPANALHLQRSISDRDIAGYHQYHHHHHHLHHPAARHAVEIERPEGTAATAVANLLPTLPTLTPSSPSPSPAPSPRPTWIVSPTPSSSPSPSLPSPPPPPPPTYSKKQLFYAKPPPPPPPYKSNVGKFIAVPDRSHLDGRPYVNWPFLYGI